MKLLAILGVVFLLSGASVAGLWLSGYFILLVPLGVFSPLAEMGLALALILLAVASAILVGVSKRPLRQRIIFAASVLAMATLPWAASWRLKGFESRVKQTSDAEWLKIADDARALLRASTAEGELPRHPSLNWNREYVAELAGSYSILRFGDFPPKLFVDEDSVGIFWGSGMIGTLAIEVSSDPNRKPAAFDGFFSRRKVSDHITLVWE